MDHAIRSRPSTRPGRRVIVVALLALAALLGTVVAGAADTARATNTASHGSLVAPDSIDLPDVLDGQVEAIAVVGGRVVVGGTFTQVQGLDGTVHDQPYIFAFDRATGAVDTNFDPVLNKPVLALASAADGATVFVGGYFTTVNGLVNKKGFTKLELDGDKVVGFAGRTNGFVRDMVVDGNTVYVVGKFTKVGPTAVGHFAAVDAITGQALPVVNSVFSGEYSSATVTGVLSVDDIDLTPDGQTAVVVGNFSQIDGQSRSRLAVFDLSGPTAVLSSWNTDVYYATCPSARFPQYIKGLDVSPDGSYFVTGSTGFWRVGQPACDTVVRFELGTTDSNVQPTWFAHTGGDSVYEVAISDEVVYAGGHFRKFNNEFSPDGGRTAGPGGVPRLGMAALDPLNGLPLEWRADRNPRGLGTFELLIDDGGLWIGDDTEFINGAYHGRLKYLPVDAAATVSRPDKPVLPTTLFRANPTTGALEGLSFDGTTFGAPVTISSTGWDSARGGVVLGGQLFYGSTESAVYARTISDAGVGARASVKLNGLTTTEFPMDRIGGMYFDHDRGRVYYTVPGDTRLFHRHFTPATPIFGDRQFEVAGDGVVPWADVRGMDQVGAHLYYGHVNGTLYRVDLAGGQPVGGTTVALSGPGIDGQNWSVAALAFFSGGDLTLPSAPDSTIDTPTRGALLGDSAVTIGGTAFAGAGVGGVAVAVQDDLTSEWLRADGSFGSFEWLSASVEVPGETLTNWTLDVQLRSGSFTAISRADDVNGTKEEDRPNQKFVVTDWQVVNGGLTTISMGADGSFWGVNRNDDTYRRTGITGSWQRIAADFVQVDALSFASALSTDAAGVIRYFDGTTWNVIPGGLDYPSMGADGSLWGVNSNGSVYRRAEVASPAWTQMPGVTAVKVDALDYNRAVALDAAGQVRHFDGTTWISVPGQLSAVSYGTDGSLWGVNLAGQTVRALGVGAPWEVVYSGLPMLDVDALDYYHALGTSESNRILYFDDPVEGPPLDPFAPTTQIDTPVAGATLASNTLNLTGSAADNVGVDAVTVAIRNVATGEFLQADGTFTRTRADLPALLAAPGNTTSGFTFDVLLPAAAGSFEAIVGAADAAGNNSSETTVPFQTPAVQLDVNLVTNGSFEDVAWSGVAHEAPAGWLLGGTPSAGGLHRSSTRATDGVQYVPFGGWSSATGATLAQELTLTPGNKYRLTHDLSAQYGGVNQAVRVELLDAGGAVIFSADSVAPAGSRSSFVHEFTATTTASTLRFTHIDGASGDGDFDNVRLVENLVENGSFEDVVWTGATHEQPAGWTLGGVPSTGGLHRNPARATDGVQYIPFGGWSRSVGAELSQALEVVSGETYSIAYDLNADWGDVNQAVRLDVFDSGGGLILSADSTTLAGSRDQFQHEFIATTSIITVRFTHIDGAAGDGDFDNVRIYPA